MLFIPLTFVASLIFIWREDIDDLTDIRKSLGYRISDSITILLITLVTFFFNSLIIVVFHELGMKNKRKVRNQRSKNNRKYKKSSYSGD
jgi:hypothetical protein